MSFALNGDGPVTRNSESDGGEAVEHDPHFEPIVSLPLVTVSTNEENEVEMCKIRAKLYRFDKIDHEWKERGTGDVKLLRHMDNNTVRIVMRRDKTLKICANHFITADLQLNPHIGSTRAFNWTTFGDFADETAKQEFLAIKFGSVENANLWKTKFDEAQEIVRTQCSLYNGKAEQEEESESHSESESNLDDSSNSSTKENKQETPQKVEEPAAKTEDSNEDKVILKLSELLIENNVASEKEVEAKANSNE